MPTVKKLAAFSSRFKSYKKPPLNLQNSGKPSPKIQAVEPRTSSPKNWPPCQFLGYEFASELASAWNHRHPRPKIYIRVHFWAASLQANLLLHRTTDILPVLKYHLPLAFENSLSGSVHPCTLPDASFCCTKTSLLTRTTAIRGGSETTRRKQK